jgi:2-oxoglutarate-Fe(II)-dependent oxygenase superfamily protein
LQSNIYLMARRPDERASAGRRNDSDMDTLFGPLVTAADLPSISGLRYISSYIDDETEAALVAAIDGMAWDTAWNRRRQPYGRSYGPAGNESEIPAWGLSLARTILVDGFTNDPFDQMLVNEYLPGQGIALHRDYEPFGRTVASVSLLSSVVMSFRHRQSGRKETLLLERRSLLVLSDVARYEWEHGIAPRKSDIWRGFRVPRERRISITFRTRKAE